MFPHNIIETSRVYKLNAYMIPGCPLKILNKRLYCVYIACVVSGARELLQFYRFYIYIRYYLKDNKTNGLD